MLPSNQNFHAEITHIYNFTPINNQKCERHLGKCTIKQRQKENKRRKTPPFFAFTSLTLMQKKRKNKAFQSIKRSSWKAPHQQKMKGKNRLL